MTKGNWELLGPIVRTQIHTDRMVDLGHYDASKIVEVDEIRLSPAGLTGVLDGVAMLHGHHQQHPNKSREHRPRTFLAQRLLSIGFTSHYAAMEEHFGEAQVGCAAEDLIVSCEGRVTAETLRDGIQIRRGATTIAELTGALPAQPCVPFATFMLGSDPKSARVDEAINFLRDGIRGFRFGIPSLRDETTVAVGHEVWHRA